MKINIAPRNKSSSPSDERETEREREKEEARRIERYNEASKGREKQAVGRVWQHIITVIRGTSN